MVCVTDPEGRIILVNERLARLFLTEPRDLLGKEEAAVFPAPVAQEHREIATRVLRSGEPVQRTEVVNIRGRQYRLRGEYFSIPGSGQSWFGVACVWTAADNSDEPESKARDSAAFFLDSSAHIVVWGKTAEQLFGYEQTEALGRHFALIYAAEEVEAGVPAASVRMAERRRLYESDSWQTTRTGARFRANVVLSMTQPATGAYETCLVFVSKLFSEGQRVNRPPDPQGHRHSCHPEHSEIRGEAEELSRAVLNSVPSHIAVLNPAGDIIQVNEAWRRYAVQSGASPEGVGVGANYLDACRHAKLRGVEEATAALEGISAVLSGSRQEYRMEYASHSPEAKRWFLLTAVPLSMARGGAVIAHTDITERVVAEQKARETSEFFRALIENASDVVSIVDAQGAFRYLSPSVETVLGYQADELLGRSCLELTSPGDVPRLRQSIESLDEHSATALPLEFSFRHKQGGWRILEGLACQALNNPVVHGILLTLRDITDRRETEWQLHEKEKALHRSHRTLQSVAARLIEAEQTERRRVARELHDDLNQKIGLVAMDVGGLARTLPQSDPEYIAHELKTLQSRLTQLCGQVRTMAYQLHPSMLDDLGLVTAVRSYCAEFSRREGIGVRFTHRRVSSHLPQEVAVNVYRITQEALRNVAKHSGAREASVSLTQTAQDIVLVVRDAGGGFQVESVRAQGGLGLTSMEERARMLRGSLEIESEAGRGTTITARIPWDGGVENHAATPCAR